MVAWYRVRQFLRMAGTLEPGVAADRAAALLALLTPAERGLFDRLASADQRHSLDVADRLARAGHADPTLLRAALLHDIGKAEAHLRLWHRVALVLAGRFAPAWWDWLTGDGRGWRWPLYVARHHAARGADRLHAAGTPAEIVELVRHHERPGGHPLGRLLRAYDSTD